MEGAGKAVSPQLESELLQHSTADAVAEVKSENADAASGGEEESLNVKRKRGWSRKQPGVEEARPELMASPENPKKRGRGRPRGTGKWQILAATLGTMGNTAGTDFTPYVISIQEGENIAEMISSFSRSTPDSVCILSAAGTISIAEIIVPASATGIVKLEDQFSIVNLNGSHTYDNKRCGGQFRMSVQLANKDGNFIGGAVAGALIASGATQIIIATFRHRVIRRPKVNKGLVGIVVPPQVAGAEADGSAFDSPNPSETDHVGRASPPPISPPPPLHVDWKEFGPSVETKPEHAT